MKEVKVMVGIGLAVFGFVGMVAALFHGPPPLPMRIIDFVITFGIGLLLADEEVRL